MLFEDNSNMHIKNYLKEFMYFLKFTGKQNLIDFSYASSDASTHKDLTIKQNIILDAVPTSINKDDESSFDELLESIDNNALKKLIQMLGPTDIIVKELSKQTTKLASIVKCILSKSEYIFLIEPEDHLNSEQIELVKSALNFEVEKYNRIVFLKALNNDLWLDLATNIVTRDQSNKYVCSPNPILKLKRQNEFKSTYDFTLLKSAS